MATLSMFYGLVISMFYGDNKQHKLPHLEKIHPDMCKNFSKGTTLCGVGGVFYSLSYFLGIAPVFIIGGILNGVGSNKLNDAFTDYYSKCFDINVCTKYGITITPYNTKLIFKSK
jgi:hypothetical protein